MMEKDLVSDCGDSNDFHGGILNVLENLYASDRIYSNIGDIIIATNPFKDIPALSTREVFREYSNIPDQISIRKNPTSPHVWTVTRDAILYTLKGSSILQSIVICGESGAGKTETAKKCSQYLASFQKESSSLESRIMSASTLIDSFGNAKTCLNNNSTRHGKWLEMYYEVNCPLHKVVLTHARFSTFLLEKSRVTSQRNNGQRNYHIFYQLCANGRMDLEAANSYKFLLEASVTDLNASSVDILEVDDRVNFVKTEDAVRNLLFTDEEKDAIFSALKCILLLGNVDFLNEHVEGSDSMESATVNDDSLTLLEEVSDRLGLDVEVLAMSFLVRETLTGAGMVETPLTIRAASDARDSLCKEIYHRLFNSIVQQANTSLLNSSPLEPTDSGINTDGQSCIGLLDMFGFENFVSNSLEQLFINYASEKMLSYFIASAVQREQALYLTEEVPLEPLLKNRTMNGDILSFFEAPTIGFFARLGAQSDVSMVPDEYLLDTIDADVNTNTTKSFANACYLRDTNMSKSEFEIRHFACTVRYNTHGFAAKNRDLYHGNFDNLLASSSNNAFRRIMSISDASSSSVEKGSSRFVTNNSPVLSERYPLQMNQLLEVLESSETHFIQCIRPNRLQLPSTIDKDFVLTQLDHSGILDAFQIKKNGFPLRFSHEEFSKLYQSTVSTTVLAGNGNCNISDISEFEKCKVICEDFQKRNLPMGSSSKIVVGKTMVFAQQKAIQQLNEDSVAIAVGKLQRFFRMAKSRMVYLQVKRSWNKLNALTESAHGTVNADLLAELETSMDELHRVTQQANFLVKILALESAKKTAERLHRIQDLNDEIQQFLISQSGDSNNAVTQELNAVDCERAQHLLSVAEELEYPAGTDLMAKLIVASEKLQRKASIVQQLKLGISDVNESLLENAVQRVELLSDSDGLLYSEEDSLLAQNLLSQIRSERANVRGIWENIISMQESRSLAMASLLATKVAGDIASENFDSFDSRDQDGLDRICVLSPHQQEMMQTLEDALLSLRGPSGSNPASVFVTHVVEVLEALIEIHQSWYNEEWAPLGIKIEELNSKCFNFRSMQSESYIEVIQLIDIGVANEVGWIAEDINDSFVSPYIPSSNSESIDMYNPDELFLLIEKLREFSFCGECSTYLLKRIEFALQLIQFLRDDHYETVLYVTERDVESCVARIAEHHKLKDSISSELGVTAEELFFSLKSSHDSDEFQALFKDRQSSDRKPSNMPATFKDFDRQLDEWLSSMRSCAFQSFVIAVFGIVQPIRSVSVDEDDGFDGSSASLKCVLDYITATSERPTELVLEIVQHVTQLKEMRAHLCESNFTALIDNYNLDGISISTHSVDLSAQPLLESMQKEAWIIIRHTIRRFVEPLLVSLIENNLISGPFGSPTIDKDNLSTFRDQVQKIVAYCDSFKTQSGMELTDDVTALIHYSKSLAAVKTSYFLSDKMDGEDLEETLQSLMTLKEQFLLLPEHLVQSRFEDEIGRLNEEIEYKKIMNTFRHAISSNEGVIEYVRVADKETLSIERPRIMANETPFITVSSDSFRESRSRSMLFESTNVINQRLPGHRKRADTQFTPRLSAQSDSLTASAPATIVVDPDLTGSTSMDSQDTFGIIEDVLSKDGMRLNDDALEVQSLDDALEAAEDFLSASTYAEDLPPQYYIFVNSIELLRNLRTAVKGYSWKEAYEALNQLRTEEIMTQVPEVRSEVLAAATLVNEFYLISIFTELLQKNVSVGVQYGEVDYSSVSMDVLADMKTLCSAIECHNDRSETVRRALLLLIDLRRAQKNSDWVSVSSILKVISQEDLNKKIEFSNIFLSEVNRAAIERDNHENINVMKAAIAEEEIPSSNGLIQFNKISTEKLGAAHVKAYMVTTENRGFVFKSLFTMVEVLLKIRKNLMQKKWNEMITLLPFLQESNDAFLNMLENLDKSSGSPKKIKESTLLKGSISSLSPKPPRYSRLQSVRNSMVGGANIDTSSMKIPSVFWDTYMGISQLIQADINTIQTHTYVSELEDQLNTALQSNFVRVNQNGSIDRSKVSATDLGKALDLKTKLESTNKLTLSSSVIQLSKSARLAFEIRQAVLEDDWQKLNSLVEGTIDGDFGFMQDCTRREIQVIRAELQNRWIISNLQDALKIGRVKGSLQKVDLTEVSCDHFESYISTAKSLNPTTEEAMKLLSSVERMSELRKLICSLISVNWNEVRVTATAILDDVGIGAVSEILREELELIKAASDDTLKCDFLMVALRKGGPSGSPGSIDLSTIDTADLEVAYNAAALETVKTDTLTNLMNACRIVQYLRNALLQAAPLKEDALAAATWHSVSLYIAMIDDYWANHPEDESFRYCEKEIALARQHAALRNIHLALISSVIRASYVYSERNGATIDDGDATPQLLSTDDLEDIVSSCKTLGFQNDISVQFQSCAAALKEFRSMVNSGKWIALKEMVGNSEMLKALKVVSQAERELAWIVCETSNHFVIEIVTDAVKSIASPDQTEDDSPLKDVNENAFLNENRSLEVAMSQVVNFKVTSTTAQQLLDSFSQLLRLRRALEVQNHSLIVTMLRWFRENAHICTSFIHAEAQRCYVIYQNAQLVRHLRATLQIGKPAGPCGDLRTQSIDLDNLQRLLNQCKVIKPLTASALQMKEAAIVVLGIRTALKAGGFISLRNCIEEVFAISQSNSSIHSLIVDEIAIAKSELDNETVVQALLSALQSYDISAYILDGCFISESEPDIDDHISRGERKSIDCLESLVDKLILGRFPSADSHDGGVGYKNAIDIDLLDDALEVAIRYGILSERAKRLHRTAVLVRSCRNAFRCSDWIELEALLFKSGFQHGVHQGDYDSVAEKEICILETQVKLRSAIIDVTTALKSGWANCANGIVDTTTLETDQLSDALDRADQSLRVMYAFTQVAYPFSIDIESSDFNQVINKQLNELLRSGKEILRIRSCLRRGHVHEAIELIDIAICYRTANTSEQNAAATLTMAELLLYSKDITIAMSVISTFDTILEDGLKSGDVGKLGALISGVKESHPTFLNDLGLVKILFHAEEVHFKLKDITKALPSFEACNNREELLKTIAIASLISPADSPSIAILESRLAQLDKFESLVSDLSSERLSYLSDRSALQHVLSYAGANCLQEHAHTVRARQLLSLSKANFLKSAIAHAVAENNSLAAAIYTIQLKLPYLSMKSSVSKYQLQNFPLLRTTAEYGVRMNVISLDLQKNMLLHTHQSLPTSLTKLSPQLAALAVWVFTHCISAIERNMYSHSDIQLTKLIRLGCSCIPMRDEIYIQLIKQTRCVPAMFAQSNAAANAITNAATSGSTATANVTSTTATSATADETSSRLIWTTMCLCLQSFPPSKMFEPYMETYFLSKIRESKTQTSNLAKSCLVSLHQTVFRHGYKSPIEPAELLSTIQTVSKLISDRTLLDNFHSVRSSLSKKVEYGKNSSVGGNNHSSSGSTATNTGNSNRNNVSYSHESIISFVSRHLDGVLDANSSPSESEVERTDSEQAVGTRGDWETRFRQFNSSLTNLTSRYQFATCMAGFIMSSTTSRDRDILCYILCGRRSVVLSETISSLRREYLGSRELFHYADDKEQAVSVGRQWWLENHMHIATPSAEGCHIDLDRWTVTHLAGILWDEVVSKIPQNINAGYDQDRPQSGRFRGTETHVGTSLAGHASKTGSPFVLLASSATKSAEEDGTKEELCALISIEMDMMLYRDLIIAGMKIYCSQC